MRIPKLKISKPQMWRYTRRAFLLFLLSLSFALGRRHGRNEWPFTILLYEPVWDRDVAIGDTFMGLQVHAITRGEGQYSVIVSPEQNPTNWRRYELSSEGPVLVEYRGYRIELQPSTAVRVHMVRLPPAPPVQPVPQLQPVLDRMAKK